MQKGMIILIMTLIFVVGCAKEQTVKSEIKDSSETQQNDSGIQCIEGNDTAPGSCGIRLNKNNSFSGLIE